MLTSAFTCTGPYAILIMMGVKKVENRSAMPVPAKGRCAVSCSKSFCKEEFGEFVRWAAANLPEEDFERMPSWGDVKDWPGAVVGCCDYEAREAATGMSPPRAGGVGAECRTPRANSLITWDEGYPYWWKLSFADYVRVRSIDDSDVYDIEDAFFSSHQLQLAFEGAANMNKGEMADIRASGLKFKRGMNPSFVSYVPGFAPGRMGAGELTRFLDFTRAFMAFCGQYGSDAIATNDAPMKLVTTWREDLSERLF